MASITCARRACSRPPMSRTSVRARTAMSSAWSWKRLAPTTSMIESSDTVRSWNRPRRRLISSRRRTDCSSRCGVMRPVATAAVIAAIAESGSAGIRRRSEPARNARTVASPAPYFATMAPIVSASVTTRPGKRSESRSRPVSTAAERVPGSSEPVKAGNAMCALITTSAPAAIPARNGTSSIESSRAYPDAINGRPMCESIWVSPWPGKCLSVASIAWSCSPRTYSVTSRDTVRGSSPNDRILMIGLAGLLLTSASGAKLTWMPTARPSTAAAAPIV